MPNGFDNPYQSYAGDPSVVDVNYVTDWGGAFGTSPSFGGTAQLPINLGGYEYGGFGGDIMNALQNVFSTSGVDVPAGGIGQGIFESQIEQQLIDQGLYAPPSTGWAQTMVDAGTWDPFQITYPEDYAPGGGGSALAYTDIFDPESIAATLSALGGLTGDSAIGAAEVKGLTPEMIEKTTSQFYKPYEDVKREDLLGKVTESRGKVGTGGFAGSGQRQSGLSDVDRLYRGGYSDIISQIEKLRAGASGDVMDTIYGWQEQLSETIA